MMPGSQPLVGRQATVQLGDYALMPLVGGDHAYVETEGERFGEKISVGNLGYQDFNPYESAESCGPWSGGFGLQRYSDHPDAQVAHSYITQASDADTADGYIIMSAERTLEDLPGNVDTVVWLGQWTSSLGTPYLLAVAGRRVYYQLVGGLWQQSALLLAAKAIPGGIGTFGEVLIFGYGGVAPAQYTNDLLTLTNITTDTPEELYVYVVTADHAQAYVGGGTTVAVTTNVIFASADGITYDAGSATSVGQPTEVLTGLAPGAGLGIVYCATKRGLGLIADTTPPIYNELIPFDYPNIGNGIGLGWLLGSSGDAQRGPVALHFNRDGDPWIYAPDSQSGGEAQNIAPWAQPYMHPTSDAAIGVPTAWLGTARWLYYALFNINGGAIVRRDLRTGATHHFWALNGQSCLSMALSNVIDGTPRLYAGYGTQVAVTVVPAIGGSPLVSNRCRFEDSATVDFPAMDLGFPDEPDVHFAVRVHAKNLSPGVRTVRVSYALDDAATYQQLGIADQDDVTEILFDPPPQSYSIRFRLALTNTDPQNTPIIYGFTSRKSINPTLYRQWQFTAALPAGELQFAHDLQDPYTVQQGLWTLRAQGVPVSFTDVWGNAYLARIMKLAFRIAALEEHRPPQWLAEFVLLQASGQAVTYTTYSTSQHLTTQWPLPVPLPTVSLATGLFTLAFAVTNSAGHAVYPRWVITGEVHYINVTSPGGLNWTWSGYCASTLFIDFAPTRKTVVDQDGVDLTDGVASDAVWWSIGNGGGAVTGTLAGTTPLTILNLLVPSA